MSLNKSKGNVIGRNFNYQRVSQLRFTSGFPRKMGSDSEVATSVATGQQEKQEGGDEVNFVTLFYYERWA